MRNLAVRRGRTYMITIDINNVGASYIASISRLSPSKRTNCSVIFDPRKGNEGEGLDDLMLPALDVASCSAC